MGKIFQFNIFWIGLIFYSIHIQSQIPFQPISGPNDLPSIYQKLRPIFVDSILILSYSDKKLEILKVNEPLIKYYTEKDRWRNQVLDGAYARSFDDSDHFLKNGEIIIYDRYFNIIERRLYENGTAVLIEQFYSGKLQNEINLSNCKKIISDTTYVTKLFTWDGWISDLNFVNGNFFSETYLWFQKTLTQHSVRKGNIAIVDYWTDKGYFEKREKGLLFLTPSFRFSQSCEN